jgi:hypothetical protein
MALCIVCQKREATDGRRMHNDEYVGPAWCLDCLDAMVRSRRHFHTGQDILDFRAEHFG